MKNGPIKVVTLEFTSLEFYEHFMVSNQVEDEILDQSRLRELTEQALAFFKGKNFVYIARRKTEYNVDPTIYALLSSLTSLKGIAVVSSSPTAVNMANFERNFSPVPYEVFLEMDDAVEWGMERLKE